MEVRDLEARLRSLLRGKYSSLSLEFNECQSPNYQEAKDFFPGDEFLDEDWISPEEREKALAENSVWRLQWYPETPVGFCALQASSLEALISKVFEDAADER